jgi:hypothetical protein
MYNSSFYQGTCLGFEQFLVSADRSKNKSDILSACKFDQSSKMEILKEEKKWETSKLMSSLPSGSMVKMTFINLQWFLFLKINLDKDNMAKKYNFYIGMYFLEDNKADREYLL